jgi:hypothetical protein
MSLTPRIDNLDAGLNLFLNSNFDFFQRNSTGINLTGSFGYQSADRWGGWGSGSGTRHLIERATFVPNTSSKYSMKITGTATSTSVRMLQRIEAANLRPYVRGKVTAIFYVYNGIGSSTTPTITVQVAATEDVHTAGSDPTYDFVVQACPNSMWTRVSTTIDLTTIPNVERGIAIWISFPSIDSASEFVHVAQAMLVPGEFANDSLPPYRPACSTIAEELAACQRYYEKSYAIDTNPGTVVNTGQQWTIALDTGTTATIHFVPYKVTKRLSSVAATNSYSPITGTVQTFRNQTTAADIPSAATGPYHNGVLFRSDGVSITKNDTIRLHFTADAEL